MTKLSRRALFLADFRAPLIVLVLVVPFLAVASSFVQHRVDDTASYERSLRRTQIARGFVLRVQLNEETGVRGYTSTGDRTFLEPYLKASAQGPLAFDALARGVAGVGLTSAEPLVARARALNGEWLERVARPLVARPARTPGSLALQRLGKDLVERFRQTDGQLQTILDSAASAADENSRRAISLILVIDVVAVGLLAAAALIFGYLQARTSRAAFESRVLYENEKKLADKLQEAFLQKELPLMPGVGLSATYLPASKEAQVGGDWYDAFELPDGRILFSIGDVAGHGVAAAVVMNRARQSIVTAALQENDPAAVLSRANRSLLLQDSRMVTAICGYLDPRTRDFSYATAGHPAPVLARADGRADFLPHLGLPLGIVPDADYTTFGAQAAAGDLFVLYTDGVLEHTRDVIAGQARLLDAVKRATGAADPALDIQQYVFRDSAPTDDVAILTISFRPVEGDGEGAAGNVSAPALASGKR